MIRILFVCHGNICRSVMAEWIFKDLVSQKGLLNDFEIDSAALSSEETGNSIYPPAAAVLRKRHIPFGEHYAWRLRADQLSNYDHIYYMDEENEYLLERLVHSSKLPLFIEPLLEHGQIADPWYTRSFEKAFSQIEQGCKERLDQLIASE
ncbi:low molecular weight protein-tyrosine-phosphatase [uncultured Allobaculum sp.]|uniref:low molecular weight protein-tyrosine-phosphatase n=1 Tax=uncultured Allobaculum sp. TaxID=1187017 RepID=UPI00259B06C1|nr:low molecular weight protein-tyrosine-phosphatase [uncultured Allobaculum sp.]